MANNTIDLRKLKNELKGTVTPENELPPPETILLQTETEAHPEGFGDDAIAGHLLIEWEVPDFEHDQSGHALLLIFGVLLGVGAVGALTPLPGNAYLGPGAAVGNGHNFIDIYLTYAGERIVSDIQQGLSRLKAGEGTATDGCFTPPENGLGYKTKQVLFAVADPAATGIKVAAVTGFKGAALAFNGITGGLAAVGSFLGSVADAVTPAPRTANLPGSHNVVSTIYGSSVTEEDLNDLLGDSQGGAVALAVQEEPVPMPETKSDTQGGAVLGAETETSAAPAPAPDPAAQALYIPPLYPVGGGGSAGFGGGGGGGSASSEPVQEETAAADTTTTDIVATTTETAAATTTETVTETATTTETVTETATTTETVVETATSTIIAEQLDASVLGETNDAHIGNGNPTQKLGSGLSGLAGSVAYRLRGSDLASTTMGIPGGFGEVQLFACFSGSYVACNKRASSDFHPQILSQSGNDATMLVDMISSAYSFDPAQYYYLMWVTNGDMAVYGSAGDTYANGAAEWSDGSFAPDANISDVAFRICSTAQCVLP